MDCQRIESLLTETKTYLDRFQSSGKEAARIDAQQKAIQLVHALERPRDAILKLSFSPTVFMAVKVAHDLGVFPVLAQATKPVPVTELAAVKQADPLLVERMMRLLIPSGFAEEPEPCKYLPTAISKEMTQRTSAGVVESLFHEFLPSIQKTPEFLQATNYRNPDDPMYAPLQYTHQLKIDGFTWLCQNSAALTRFNSFMEGQRANRAFWGDWFPVRERVLNGLKPERPLLVDIGGGRGHDLLMFRERFPDTPGQLVLAELPSVIDEVRCAYDLNAAGVATVGHDFFAENQPVQGARAYYFKYVLHDWSDEKATIIFSNLKSAMQRGYSKILIEEYILPDRNAHVLPCMTDMAVMVFCSGLERTKQRWTNLLQSVGLRILQFWVREGDGLGVIEADLPEESTDLSNGSLDISISYK